MKTLRRLCGVLVVLVFTGAMPEPANANRGSGILRLFGLGAHPTYTSPPRSTYTPAPSYRPNGLFPPALGSSSYRSGLLAGTSYLSLLGPDGTLKADAAETDALTAEMQRLFADTQPRFPGFAPGTPTGSDVFARRLVEPRLPQSESVASRPMVRIDSLIREDLDVAFSRLVERFCANAAEALLQRCRELARHAEQACRGNQASISFVQKEFARKAVRVSSNVPHSMKAEDIAQELFVVFWQRCREVIARQIAVTPQYVHTIAVRMRRDLARQAYNAPITEASLPIGLEGDAPLEALSADAFINPGAAEAEATTRILVADIVKALEARRVDMQTGLNPFHVLDSTEVAVIQLRVFQDHDNVDVARKLGLAPSEVSRVFYRARTKLNHALRSSDW